jgi:hypothetical protein
MGGELFSNTSSHKSMSSAYCEKDWIPASAGMTDNERFL